MKCIKTKADKLLEHETANNWSIRNTYYLTDSGIINAWRSFKKLKVIISWLETGDTIPFSFLKFN